MGLSMRRTSVSRLLMSRSLRPGISWTEDGTSRIVGVSEQQDLHQPLPGEGVPLGERELWQEMDLPPRWCAVPHFLDDIVIPAKVCPKVWGMPKINGHQAALISCHSTKLTSKPSRRAGITVTPKAALKDLVEEKWASLSVNFGRAACLKFHFHLCVNARWSFVE